jgi:hypothetical protein
MAANVLQLTMSSQGNADERYRNLISLGPGRHLDGSKK